MADPVNTIYDDMQVLKTSVLTPKNRVDSEDATGILRNYLTSYAYLALVTGTGPTNDAYMVDVYEHGLLKADGTDQDPTRKAVLAHVLHTNDFPSVGDLIHVRIMIDQTALIVPERPVTLGIIVCRGPASEADFTNEHYWVAFAYQAGTSAASPNIIKFPSTSRFL